MQHKCPHAATHRENVSNTPSNNSPTHTQAKARAQGLLVLQVDICMYKMG